MAEFPALPLWTDAYLADTTHLSTIQHGAFLLLLFAMWRSKDCRVPDDNKFLARVTGLSGAQWQRTRPILEPMNEVKNGWWSNGRLRDELNVVRRQRDQKKHAGRASALKRLNRGSTFVEQPLNGCSTPTPTPTPTSITSKEVIGQPKKQRRILPTQFPLEEDKAWALQLWLQKGRTDLAKNIEEESAKFRDHHSAKLTSFADWPAAWRTWTRNAMKFNKGAHNGRAKSSTAHDNLAAGSLLLLEEIRAKRAGSGGAE